MICTPVFINTFVVFVRLYWFERRFQNVAREARNFKPTRSRTRTPPKDDSEPGITEKSVRGRSIVVMHNGDTQTFVARPEADHPESAGDLTSGSRTDSSSSQRGKTDTIDHASGPPPQRTPTFRRDITFADEVKSPDDDDSTPQMLPQRLSPEQHIAFLQNQRNPKEEKALRIPGPRDFDRGRVPEPLDSDEEDGGQLRLQDTGPIGGMNGANDDPLKRNVAIDAPDHPQLRANLPRLSTRKSGTLEKSNGTAAHEIAPQSAGLRARTGTFSSLRNWASKENTEPVTPYLSWQPTIGRNSAFVDLTEEQREELGGIEYRALKTLAVVLVCKSFSRSIPVSLHPLRSSPKPITFSSICSAWSCFCHGSYVQILGVASLTVMVNPESGGKAPNFVFEEHYSGVTGAYLHPHPCSTILASHLLQIR